MKKIITILLLMSLLSTLCGCDKQPEQDNLQTTEEETITLTFFGNISATEKIRTVEQLIHDYMEEHPNVTIIYEGADPTFALDYNKVLTKRLSTGNGDDIMLSYAGYLPTLAEAGYLVQLDELDSWDEYNDMDKENLEINGHYYGIPMENTVIGMYCNMDLLEKYQLEVPKNYEELLSVSSILQQEGITPITASQMIPFSGYAYADGMAKIYRVQDADENVKQIAQQKQNISGYFEEGFTHLEELLTLGYINRANTLASDNTENAEKSFANGECAFLVGASDLNASIQYYNDKLNYEIYPIPVSQGDGVVFTAPDHLLCVNKKSPNKDAAIDFVNFCTSRINVENYVKKQDSISPLKGEITGSKRLAPVLQLISNNQQIPSVDYRMGVRLQNWVQQVGISLLSGKDVEACLEELDKLVDEELNHE